jgi:hypothetical protein
MDVDGDQEKSAIDNYTGVSIKVSRGRALFLQCTC